MANNMNEAKIIDLGEITRVIWKSRKTFYKVLSIVFVLSCVWILPQPRTYTSEVKLAPEMENSTGGTLGSLASSFGFDLGDMQSSDAISPELYPDLIETNDFITLLFPVEVETKDGTLKTTYFDYLSKHRKDNPLTHPFTKAMQTIKGWFSDKSHGNATDTVDPTQLTKPQANIVNIINKSIKCDVNKKTGVITIVVIDQDPLIAATIAKVICQKLQNFITDYRTNKARIDVGYYEDLASQQLAEYEDARREYISFADSNRDIISPVYQQKLNDLENTMQLKYNAYTSLQAQLMAARAKLQERTPAFTTLKSASVPLKPTGPKRMAFVIAMLFLSSFVCAIWLCRFVLFKQ